MYESLKSHFKATELLSMLHTFIAVLIAFLIVDGKDVLVTIYDGTITRDVLDALKLAVFRSGIKAFFTLALPSSFPKPSNVTISSTKSDKGAR